jgi:protein-disulfide isomerase
VRLAVLLLTLLPTLAAAQSLDPGQVYDVPVDGAPSRGPRDAKITIVEFGEYHCPYCARAEETMAELERLYPGEIRRVFRHRIVHVQTAYPPAEAAMAADAQGKFWPMHAALLADRQGTTTRKGLESIARSVGLDVGRLRRELDGRTHERRVSDDDALAQRLGVSGTPTFFVNGRPIVGALPASAFRPLIDAELARADKLLASGVKRPELYGKLTSTGLDAPEPPAPPPPVGKRAIPLEIERTLDALEACRDGNQTMARIAYDQLKGARKRLVQGDCKAMGVNL